MLCVIKISDVILFFCFLICKKKKTICIQNNFFSCRFPGHAERLAAVSHSRMEMSGKVLAKSLDEFSFFDNLDPRLVVWFSEVEKKYPIEILKNIFFFFFPQFRIHFPWFHFLFFSFSMMLLSNIPLSGAHGFRYKLISIFFLS